MMAMSCANCAAQFAYNPSRPTRKYCAPACRGAAEEKRRARTAADKNAARARADEEHDVEFIAVDGEGVNRWEYREVWDDVECAVVLKRRKAHDYVLLSVGSENLYREDGAALTHHEIFPFLYAQKLAHPKAAFVGFFLGYDFSQWFKSIPEISGWKMFHKAGIESRMPDNTEMKYPFPVYVEGKWELDILGMKRVKLRPHVKKKDWPACQVVHKSVDMLEACERGEHRKHPHKWMFICDTGAFFQSSLLQVLNPKKWVDKEGRSTAIVTEDEMSILIEGKGERASAQFDSPSQREDMIRYNILENDVLARLMKVLNEGFVSDGVKLRNDQWFGPGQAAQAWLRLIGAPTGDAVREAVPPWAVEAARRSYYGGWFETFIHGVIPGTTYGYDINSAYPYAIANLPCLLHGVWTHGTGSPGKRVCPPGTLRLVHGIFSGDDSVIGTMPHRDANGAICRPLETQGWHWQHEIDAARRAGMVKRVRTLAWVEYTPAACECEHPLDNIRELYEGRLLVGKETPFGKTKKLMYNSAYGKMAQSVGMPKYSNSVYASLITSVCRTMIIDAIATHPDKTRAVAMIATDGVYFLTPHPTLPTHKDELGKWSADNHENLSILMPGLYWDDDSRESVHSGESLKLKSRGVSGKYLAPFIDRFDTEWARVRSHFSETVRYLPTDEAPSQEIVVEFSVVSPRLAAARDNWDLCGRVVWDEPRLISADPRSKRAMFVLDERRPELLRTLPLVLSSTGEVETTPYDRLFGVDPETLTEYRELQDLLIMDGSASDILHAVLPG
jgi:hypothetical protein